MARIYITGTGEVISHDTNDGQQWLPRQRVVINGEQFEVESLGTPLRGAITSVRVKRVGDSRG